jgi:tape measure domain-containing protein
MSGAIDTAYVEFEARTDKLEHGAVAAFDDVVALGRHVTEAVDRAFVEMTDQVIHQFEKLRAEADSSFDHISSDVQKVEVAISTGMNEVVVNAERGFDELISTTKSGLESISSSIQKVSERTSGMSRNMSTAIGTMAGFVAGNAVMNGLSQAYQFTKDAVIGFNETLENSGIAFTTVLGSAQRAQSFIQQLKEFAVVTPFDFGSLVTYAQRMMGMGVAAKDVIPDLRALGDSVASVGGSSTQLEHVTLAFDQMVAKGTLDMGNMNQLLQGGVPNALRILADAYQVTTGQMIQMISTGKVQSSEALPKLIEGLEHGTKSTAALGGMMERQSRTLSGALSNVSDALQQAIAGGFKPFFDIATTGFVRLATLFGSSSFKQFGEQISSSMAAAINAFITFVSGIDWTPLINAFNTIRKIITDDLIPAGRSAANTFGPLLMESFRGLLSSLSPIASALKPVGAALRDMFGFMEQHKTIFQAIAVSVLAVVASLKTYAIIQGIITAATKAWTAAQVALDVAMDANPIGLIVVAVIALAAGIFYLWTHSEGFRKFFINMWNSIWNVLKAIGSWFAGPFAHFFIDTWNAILGFFRGIGAWFAGPFVNFFVNAWHAILALPGRILAAVKALPGMLLILFETGLQRVAFMVGFVIGSIVRFFLLLPLRIWNILTNLWDTAVNITQTGITNIISFFMQLPERVSNFMRDLWNRAISLTISGINTVIAWVSGLRAQFINFVSNMWNTGVALFERGVSVAIAIISQLPGRIWGIISGLPGMIWGALSGLGSTLYNIGANMVIGLVNGISHFLGWAVSQARNAALSIAHGFTSALGIHSPSKLFADYGQYTVQGYVQGVEQEIGSAHTAVKQIVSPAMNAVSAASGKATSTGNQGFNGTVVVNVGGRQVAGTIVDILYDNAQHVSLAAQQGDRKLVRR